MSNTLRSAWPIVLAALLLSSLGCSGGEGTDAATDAARDAGTGTGDLLCGPLPSIDRTSGGPASLLIAEVSEGQASEVELWCSSALGENAAVREVQPDCSRMPMTPEDNTDLRHAVWTVVSMTESETGRFEATVPPSSLSYPVCVVRARTVDDKISTSGPLLSRALCEAAGLPGSTTM